MAIKVVISYSTEDLPTVGMLQKLSGPQVEIFVAEDSVAPGAMLASSIEAAIKQCDLMIVVWSRHAAASDWVKQEVGVAKGAGKRILPVMLESELELPQMIADLKYLDVTKHPDDWLLYVQSGLQAMVAAKHQGATSSLNPPASSKPVARAQSMLTVQGSVTIQITAEEALLIGAIIVVIILLASQAKGSAGAAVFKPV